MTALSEEDRARIAKAISDAEQATSAEIITVVMRAASDYWAAPILWATLVALIWPWPLISITTLSSWTIFMTQLIVFAALAIGLSFPVGRRLSITPPWIKRRRAHQSAREHFYAQGLHRTVDRSGVLIFIAAAERYAEILCDDSINVKVHEAEWRPIVAELREALARGDVAAGVAAAVKRSGALLAQHAPPRANERNELPDKVIVI